MNRIRVMSMMMLLIVLVVTGCSSESNPEETVKDCFNTIQDGKFEKLNQYVLDGDDNLDSFQAEEDEQMMDLAFQKLSYEILETVVEGNRATVKTKITAPNMTEVFGKLMGIALQKAFTVAEDQMDEVMNAEMKKAFTSEDIPMITNEVNITLEKKGNDWLIVADKTFINAITGNFLNVIESFNTGE